MKNWIQDTVENVIADLKKAHRSLTILFNTLLAAVAFAIPELIAFLPQLQQYLPEENYKTLMVIALVGNFVLRFKTSSRIADK